MKKTIKCKLSSAFSSLYVIALEVMYPANGRMNAPQSENGKKNLESVFAHFSQNGILQLKLLLCVG